MPLDDKNISKTAHVECVEVVFLIGVGCPSVAAIEENAEHNSSVHLDLGVLGEGAILPHSLGQSRHCSGCLADMFVDLYIQR